MKIFQSRKLTDAEFVEKIRKQLRINRRWAWIGIIISGTLVVLFVWIFLLFINFISSMGQLAEHVNPKSQMFYTGLALGCTMGLVLTVILGKIFLYFYKSLELLFGNRRDKLLVAYYDQFHPLDAKAPAPSSAEKFSH
jgi:hypothetical protein